MRLSLCVFLLVLVSACNRSNLESERRFPKNPSTLPTTTPTDPSTPPSTTPPITRTVVAPLEYSPSFLQGLRDRNFYDPDNCVQWVKFTQGTTELGSYLEISAVPCPGTGVVEEDSVLLRLTVKQHPQYFTQYRLVYEQSYSPEVGVFRRLVNNGTTSYRLEGLCDLDPLAYRAGWDQFCRVEIESSLFRSPDPLEFFNLD